MPSAFAPVSTLRPRSLGLARHLAGSLALWGLLLGALGACKAGEGDACRCASDCRGGFQCAAEGFTPLELANCESPGVGAGCCYPAAIDAICIPAAEVASFDSSASAVDPTADGYPMNKRDFGLPTASGVSDSESDSEATSASDTDTDPTTGTTSDTDATTSDTDATTADTDTDATTSDTDATTSDTDATTSDTDTDTDP